MLRELKFLISVAGVFLLPGQTDLWGQPALSTRAANGASRLIADLGCAQCHSELPVHGTFRELTPDLGSAGLRYQPAYLYEFLQNPVKVRPHLGRARMPDFHLSKEEALALAAFLETQRTVSGKWPDLPAAVQHSALEKARAVSREKVHVESLLCLACHALERKGGTQAVDLASISHRLQPGWVKEYLVAPSRFGVPAATMPAQYYQISDDGQDFRPMVPEAAAKIHDLTDYLFSLNTDKRELLEQKLEAARKAFPRADAALGESLFKALHCAACHRHHSIQPRATNAAPDLSIEGGRVTKTWLEQYLKQPAAIRPFGHRPGDGSRMPDYRLTKSEVTELSAFLSERNEEAPTRSREFRPAKLSAFFQAKARSMITQKLSCLGCHRLGEQGGRIGPDLTNVRQRLQPEYVFSIIQDPRQTAPHSMMPQIPLAADTAQLLANYLTQQTETAQPLLYLSPAQHRLLPFPDPAGVPGGLTKVKRDYLTYCAACHGPEGRGDGFNVAFLPVKPTAHAEAKHMATRADDTLFDGIHSGGAILNKSHLMPPWGQTLTADEIKALVKHIRTLCGCEGPAWSRDN